eukprot:534515_1
MVGRLKKQFCVWICFGCIHFLVLSYLLLNNENHIAILTSQIPVIQINVNHSTINNVYLEILSNKTEIEYRSSFFKNNESLISSPLLQLRQRKDGEICALLCSHGYKPSGIGNALAIYWTARATAFFMNYSFVMNAHFNNETKNMDTQCEYETFPMFERLTSNRTVWTWFLPIEYLNADSSITSITNNFGLDMEINYIINRYNYLWQSNSHYSIPYESELIFLSYNPFFLPIIRNNTAVAFKRYYKFKNDMIYYHNIMDLIENHNVIAIHIRSGDSLFAKRSRRILLNMKYFSIALDFIHKKLNPSKKCKIFVIAQLDAANAHGPNDILSLNASNKIVNFITQELQQYINNNWDTYTVDFTIIGNDSADNDFFRMITAQYLICSPSSFCLEAAMANYLKTKLIIFPSKGPWQNVANLFSKITDQNKNKFIKVANHHFVNVDRYSVPVRRFKSIISTPNRFKKFKRWFRK